jgi:hypothetical protein
MTTSFTIKNAKTNLQPWGTRIATSIRIKLLHDYIRKGFQLDRLTYNPGVRKIRYPIESSLWTISSYRRQKTVKSKSDGSPSLSSAKDETRSLSSKEQNTL